MKRVAKSSRVWAALCVARRVKTQTRSALLVLTLALALTASLEAYAAAPVTTTQTTTTSQGMPAWDLDSNQQAQNNGDNQQAQDKPWDSIKNDTEGFMQRFDTFMWTETQNIGKYATDLMHALAAWTAVALKDTHKEMDSGMNALQGWMQQHSASDQQSSSSPPQRL